MLAPANIQIIGNEIAIAWNDGAESYYTFDYLRFISPSAENQGEVDILGVKHGGNAGVDPRFIGVRVLRWAIVGNYAIRFDFSDGHNSGLYSYDYLRDPARHPKAKF